MCDRGAKEVFDDLSVNKICFDESGYSNLIYDLLKRAFSWNVKIEDQ